MGFKLSILRGTFFWGGSYQEGIFLCEEAIKLAYEMLMEYLK
jgi:hypothetical protein